MINFNGYKNHTEAFSAIFDRKISQFETRRGWVRREDGTTAAIAFNKGDTSHIRNQRFSNIIGTEFEYELLKDTNQDEIGLEFWVVRKGTNDRSYIKGLYRLVESRLLEDGAVYRKAVWVRDF